MSDATVKTVAMPASTKKGNGNGNGTTGPRRQLAISVLRYNPQDPASVPHMQTYALEEADGMTLFIALNEIRERQDASLQFDFVCRAGICGSCAMVINGRPTLACRTLTKNLGAEITLAPLPFFELIGDLSVNTGKWMRGMSERLEGWLHMANPDPDLTRLEQRMDPELADKIYELDRCIECGCCVAACGTARMREDFVGAVGLNRVARFRLDPRDTRNDADFYDVIGDDNGVFGCMSLPGLPRRLPEGPAARDANCVHAAEDGRGGHPLASGRRSIGKRGAAWEHRANGGSQAERLLRSSCAAAALTAPLRRHQRRLPTRFAPIAGGISARWCHLGKA